MKQSDAYKLLAAFMILIMIIVPLAYMVIDRNAITQPTPEPTPQENYNPDLWVVNQPFYYISDALNMTPYGVVNANYVDLKSMTPQMEQVTRQSLPISVDQVDSIYKSNTTQLYIATFQDKNSSFLLLSAMSPEKNDFNYIQLPGASIPILKRQDTGAINIMGTPTIYTNNITTAIGVLNIIYSQNKTITAYDQYEGLLGKVEPAQFQMVSSNESFARLFYMGIASVNGTYERTTAYLNINPSNFTRLDKLRTNSTQRGFEQYNITSSRNYTIVKIASPDLSKVLNEETS